MNEIIDKLVKKETITDEDLEKALFQICDRTHSYCAEDCPIYRKYNMIPTDESTNCVFFKDGKKMLKALRGPTEPYTYHLLTSQKKRLAKLTGEESYVEKAFYLYFPSDTDLPIDVLYHDGQKVGEIDFKVARELLVTRIK